MGNWWDDQFLVQCLCDAVRTALQDPETEKRYESWKMAHGADDADRLPDDLGSGGIVQ